MSEATLLPGNLPLRIRRGIAFGPIDFVLKDANNAAFDLTGYTAQCVARPELDSPDEIDFGAVIYTAPTNGVVRLPAQTDEQVATLLRPFGDVEMPYDLVLIDSGGNKLEPSVSGILTIESTPGGTR